MKRKKQKLGIATSMAAAAAIVGVPLMIVRKCRDKGCRAFRGNGRIDCDALNDWLMNDSEGLITFADWSCIARHRRDTGFIYHGSK